MRITMLNKYYPPHLGGIEYHARDLACALAERGERGERVRVLTTNESRARTVEESSGVEVVRLARQFGVSSAPVAFGTAKEIARMADETDVFHLHFPSPWSELSWLTARTQVPTVVTYHSDIVRQRRGLALYRPFISRLLDRVDVIIATSPDMVRHSEFLAPRADKCRVIPFGIHVERHAPTPEVTARAAQLRAEHGDRPIVLFVGRLVYYKGADVLVRAMGGLDADLVIIGQGPLEPMLREIATGNGTIERTHFLAPQPNSELIAWYHAADVFCLPSVARSEAFGLVQLEAHASGTPVVSTSLTTGVPFVNADGVTGLTVPPGDDGALAEALGTLLADDRLRLQLGEQARERAFRDFSMERMVDETLGLYREVACGK